MDQFKHTCFPENKQQEQIQQQNHNSILNQTNISYQFSDLQKQEDLTGIWI